MDIDFLTDLRDQFKIGIGDNPQNVEGNRALLNRFEITFLTKTKMFLFGDKMVVDEYAGDAEKYINRPQVLNDPQSIAGGITVSIDQTVAAMQGDEPEGIPDTEKIASAELIDIQIIDDVVFARIQVHPIEVELYQGLVFNLPIIKRD